MLHAAQQAKDRAATAANVRAKFEQAMLQIFGFKLTKASQGVLCSNVMCYHDKQCLASFERRCIGDANRKREQACSVASCLQL